MSASVAASNRLEPQTCPACGDLISPSQLCFDRVDGALVPRHTTCPRQAQPARLGGSAT